MHPSPAVVREVKSLLRKYRADKRHGTVFAQMVSCLLVALGGQKVNHMAHSDFYDLAGEALSTTPDLVHFIEVLGLHSTIENPITQTILVSRVPHIPAEPASELPGWTKDFHEHYADSAAGWMMVEFYIAGDPEFLLYSEFSPYSLFDYESTEQDAGQQGKEWNALLADYEVEVFYVIREVPSTVDLLTYIFDQDWRKMDEHRVSIYAVLLHYFGQGAVVDLLKQDKPNILRTHYYLWFQLAATVLYAIENKLPFSTLNAEQARLAQAGLLLLYTTRAAIIAPQVILRIFLEK